MKKFYKLSFLLLMLIGFSALGFAQLAVDAGGDKTMCADQTSYTLESATMSGYDAVTWTSTGSGSWGNPTTEHDTQATYYPSSNDKTNLDGYVTLTISANTTGSVTPTTDDMKLWFQAAPTADAGIDATICQDGNYELQGQVSNQSSYSWFHSVGNGSLSSTTILNPIYTPPTTGQGYTSGGFDTFTLTAQPVSPCNVADDDNVTIYFVSLPVVDAGEDNTICENSFYTTDDASATNYTAVTWTTLGDGSLGNYNSVTECTYTPGAGDYTAGSFQLTLEAGNPYCGSVSSTVTVTIQKLATADIGVQDATICEDDTYKFTNALATNQAGIQWTSGICDGKGMWGGSFDDSTSQNPTFTPSQAAIDAGCVMITMTALHAFPCGADKGQINNTDYMMLTIVKNPVADAGEDDTECAGNEYTLDGSAQNHTQVSWSILSGAGGSINNPASLTSKFSGVSGTTYVLQLTASNDYCDSDSDTVEIFFQPVPTADAGVNGTTCEGVAYTLAGSAENYSSVSWTSTGNGTFDDNTKLAAKYTPADGDNPSVTLTLHAQPEDPCSTEASDEMVLTVGNAPDVDAGEDASICESGYTLDGDVQNGGSILWTSFGDGDFSNPNILAPFYTPGDGDKIAGSVKLSLVAQSILPCTALYSDDVFLYITQDLPTVFAGADATSCETDSYTINDATATDYSELLWIRLDADGTFDDNKILKTEYTFGTGDISKGYAKLKLVASPKSPCVLLVEDEMTIYVQKAPIANAGNDATICEDGTYHLTSASASNYNSLGWYTLGSGTFDDDTKLYAKYTPGSTDIIDGSAELYLVAAPKSPCSTADQDTMLLTIQELPEADAGSNTTICEDGTYTLSGASATNYSSVTWTGGSGSFNNATAMNPVYTPAASEYGTTVTLTLTAYAINPCTTSDDDSMDLYIQELPTANAGSDETICEDGSFTVDDATAENYSSVTWTAGTCPGKGSEADGTFTGETTLTPTYTPGEGDIERGYVCLMLTAESKSPCTVSDDDIMELTIQLLPEANAGSDDTICEDGEYTLSDATASNYSSVTWSGGAGEFDYSDKFAVGLHPTYTPDPSEAGTTVTLTLTAQPISPCTTSDDDSMDLYIQALPEANAGSDASICEDGSYTVNDASAEDYSAVTWTTDGSGTFDNVASLTPTYNAGSGETGTITLTLHAEAKSPCTTEDTDEMEIQIQAQATANAGDDGETCEGVAYTLDTGDASASNNDGVKWTHDGTGQLSNETTLTPTYTPGVGETGEVTLTLTAYAIEPCSVDAEDDMTLTINALPELTSVDLQYGLAGPVPEWMTAAGDLEDGYGICIDGNGDTHYYLDVSDLESTPNLALGNMNEFFHTTTVPDGFFDYWADRGVVDGATGWQGIMWDIINGEKPIFYLAGLVKSVDFMLVDGLQYQNTPSQTMPLTLPGDYPQGDYTFSGTVKDVNGCTSEEVSITLSVVHMPTADAGIDATIASNQTYTLSDATATNYMSVSWGTSGDGTFDDDTDLNPTYAPGTDDATNGSVTLTLYVDPNAPCADQLTDAMTLTILLAPEVEITDPLDDAILYVEDYQIAGTASDGDGSVVKVEVNINDGGWEEATGTDTWTYDASFSHGLNTVKARATDDDNIVSDIDSITVYVHLHTIALTPGWQMISTYLDPLDPNIVNIMNPVVNSLTVMNNLNGIYAPAPYNVNTLVNWNLLSAYQLRMTQAGEITIAGDPLKDNTLQLVAGFHYVPVLSDQLSPISSIFSNPTTDILYMIGDGGPTDVYWPDGGLYFLENLVPGKGYFGYLNNAVTITYPEYLGYNTDFAPVPSISSESPWPIEKTGNVHLISIDQVAIGELYGMDYIGAFDVQGNCIGYTDLQIDGTNLPMLIYGDDAYTATKDGAIEGEQINLVGYNATSGETTPLMAEYDPGQAQHDGTYATKGLSIIRGLYKESTGTAEFSTETQVNIFPNPASEEINILVSKDAVSAVLEISNAEGMVLKSLKLSSEKSVVNVSELPAGVYFVKITLNAETIIQKLIIQ